MLEMLAGLNEVLRDLIWSDNGLNYIFHLLSFCFISNSPSTFLYYVFTFPYKTE